MKNDYDNIASSLPHNMSPPSNQHNAPSLKDAVEHINTIDFSLIIEKLCSKDILLCRTWSPVEIEIGLQYY